MTQSVNPTPTFEPPPPTTLPPAVQTYFGYGIYKTRYPDHTPTPLGGAISGMSLLFSTSYRSLYAARFRVSDTFNTALRLGINATAGNTYYTRLSLTKTTSAASFDGVSLDTDLCTQFIDPTTGGLTNSSSVDCGTSMTCDKEVTAIATGNHLGDSVTVTANPGSMTATCGGSSRLSGIVYASAPLTQKGFQSYALLSSSAAHASVSASAAASAFVGSTTQWLGSPSASVTGVSGTTGVYLVGDASNPTGSSYSFQYRHLAPVVVAGGLSTADLTATGGTTSYCAVPDQSAFGATFTAANATIVDGGVPSSCFAFDSVDALHAACSAAESCVGFSTVRVNRRELPLCLHLSGTNPQPATYLYDRIFYRKPSSVAAASCTVSVERSGRVAVYIQQTTFGSGGAQAVVRVGGSVVAVCGGSQPFSNGFAGLSGRCQLYALCFAGAVSAGASVTVSIQGVVGQNGCNNSLGVLVSQTSVDTVQIAATTMAPIERVTLAGATGRVVRVVSGATDVRTLPLFVYGAESVAMEVTQTGFDCTLGGCGAYSVTMRTAGTCQRCGGVAGFHASGRAGLSDQCDTGLFCGSNMSLRGGTSDVGACEAPGTTPSGSTYTGHVRVAVDPSTLRFRTSLCTGFTATVYAAPTSPTSSVPVYPLLDNNQTGFRTLLTAPSTLSATDGATYVAGRSGLTASTLAPLFNLGPFGSQVTAFYAASLGATPQTMLHVNTTLACVVDHSASSSAKCVFPVPRGSLKVRVLVAQNDFALDANQLSVSVLSGSTVRTSLQCGGSQRFGLDAGAQELCSDYRVCTDRYLYTNDADAETATDGFVTVEVPSHIRSRACNFTASIIVEFTKPVEVVPYSCSTYECPGERKCLPHSSVCDSVQDCLNNADEEWCSPWRALDSGSAFCVPTDFMTNYTGKTYTDCRRLAAIDTTSVFALIGTKCVVYSASISATILASPNDYVCDVEGATAHVRLPDGATFSLCTSSIYCSGNGVASSNTSAGACTCTCANGYTGTTCTERMTLSNIKTMIVALQTPLNMSLQVNLATLGEVLALNYTTVTVACDSILPSPLLATEVFVECTVTSVDGVTSAEYVHQRRLLVPSAWAAATARLVTLGVPGIHFITARTTMQPLLPVSSCTGTSCTNIRPYTAIRVVSLAATALESATLTITDYSSSATGTASRSERRVLSCTPASTDAGGGCVSSVCDVGITGAANSNITLSATTYASSTAVTGTCTQPSTSLQTHEVYGDVPTATNETVLNSETNFDWFLVGSLLMFVGGSLVSVVVCVVLWCVHRRRLATLMCDVDLSAMTPAEQLKTTLLGSLAYIQRCADGVAMRIDRVSISLGTFSGLCAVAASCLTIYYVTAFDRDSNFSVMYEEYTDSLCSSSPSASMPRRIFSVPHASSQCTRMSVTGETAGVVYADGKCEGSGGSYSAAIRSGGTFLTCMETSTTTVVSGSCLPVSTVNPSDTRSIYVQLTCSTEQHVSDRTSALARLTTVADVFVSTDLTELNTELQFASRSNGPPTTVSSQGGTVYQYPYLSNNVIKTSTSTRSMTVSSTASSAQFDNRYDPSRVVLQRYPESFIDAGVSFASEETSALPLMASLSASEAIVGMRPQDSDYGVGYLFGGFGTSSEVTWQGAGPQAHRHYDIRGTAFDMAHHLPRSVDELEDGAGFSVSMYLRVTNETRGFAFAVTDAFENTQAGTVYTLDRLSEMIENGQASSSWFNSTYRVYASLFVSGSSRQLTFAHADPTEADRVQLLDWDTERIGAQYLFNGLWHHVAVVYRVENGQLRATLVVDGSTSYAAEGWSVCAGRLPPVVDSIGSNGTVPVFDRSSDKATDGGLLVVGYFNGGVYGLTASPFEMLNSDYLGTGTSAMRQHNAFPRANTLALGVVLVLLGTAALVFVAVAGFIDVRRIRARSGLSEGRQIMRDFLTLQRTATSAATLFGTTVDAAFPLTPIRLSTALRWTGLDLNQFAALPSELVNQTRQPSEQLLLVLYNARTRERRSEITPTEWNALVEQDATDRAASRRCCCMEYTTDALGDAIVLGTSQDMFVRFMKCHSHKDDNNYSDDDDADVEMDDVEHRGGGRGAAEITNVEIKTSSGGGDSGVLKSLVDVLAPVIVVFQSMYVWSNSIEFPSLYDDYFADIFSFVSIDVAATFPGIPTLITPLVQMSIGFAVVAVVIYFVFEDNRRFEASLARYVWRRDALETREKESTALYESLPKTLTSVLEDPVVVEPMVQLKTFPLSECRTLDLIAGKIPKLDDDDTTDYAAIDRTTATTMEGTEYTVTRDPTDKKRLLVEDADEATARLDPIGCRCWRHPGTPLTAVHQSDVYPFSNPSTCCCVINGRLCGAQLGLLYVCGERYINNDGEEVMCTFGLCKAHCRMTLKDNIVATVYRLKRRVMTNGLSWVLAVCIVFAVNTIYTPFLKTALMILACHPQYQCEFEHCWTFITQEFALAAFLSASVVLVLGLGFPALLLMQLLRRRSALNTAFFGDEYGDTYTSPDTRGPDFKPGSWLWGRKELSVSEWARFSASDNSALALHYCDASYRWLMMPALVLLFKVFVLIPAVFLEPRSFELRLGAGLIEIGIAIFYFATSTQLSPILLMTIRAASVHQLLFLGFQNIDLVTQFDRNTSLSPLLIVITLTYVAFSVFVFIATVVYPIVSMRSDKQQSTKFLHRHGLHSFNNISLYFEPNVSEESNFTCR